MPNLSLAIIDGDSQARSQLVGILDTLGHTFDICANTDFEEGMRHIEGSQPQIVILDVREVDQGVRDTSTILACAPQTAVFVTCDQKNPDWILRLIRAGAGEFLTKPVNAGELVDAVKRVAKLHERGATPKGSAIAIYNPAGGVGTTTTAINLAAALQAGGKTVALVDLNLATPDVATLLDLMPRYTLSDAISRRGDLDANLLKSLIVPHASGIHVLAGLANLADLDWLQPELVHKMMAILRGIFEYLVIDTGGPLSRCNLSAFFDCEQILYTTALNLPGLKNAKLYLTALDGQGLGPERVKLVINRFQPKDDIPLGSAEKILHTKVYALIPDAYTEVKNSVTRGEPLVRCYPRSPFAKALGQIANLLTQETTASGNSSAAKGGWYGGSFRF